MKNQKGFSAVEGLLILIIVGLLGFIGWYVYTNQKSANKTLDTATDTSNKTVNTSDNPKYLTIKEYGVKFLLADKIRDGYYAKVGDYYYFSLHRFDNMKGAEGCRAGAFNGVEELGILALVTGRVGEDNGSPAGGIWTQADLDQSGLHKVGDTYYGFQGGNAPCWNVDNPPAKDFDNTISNLKKVFVDQEDSFVKA